MSLLNGILALLEYLMPKPSLQKNSSDTIQPIVGGGGKEVHTFPRGICTKVNLIAQLEFQLVYFKVAAKHFSHYAIGTSPIYNLLGVLFNYQL